MFCSVGFQRTIGIPCYMQTRPIGRYCYACFIHLPRLIITLLQVTFVDGWFLILLEAARHRPYAPWPRYNFLSNSEFQSIPLLLLFNIVSHNVSRSPAPNQLDFGCPHQPSGFCLDFVRSGAFAESPHIEESLLDFTLDLHLSLFALNAIIFLFNQVLEFARSDSDHDKKVVGLVFKLVFRRCGMHHTVNLLSHWNSKQSALDICISLGLNQSLFIVSPEAVIFESMSWDRTISHCASLRSTVKHNSTRTIVSQRPINRFS